MNSDICIVWKVIQEALSLFPTLCVCTCVYTCVHVWKPEVSFGLLSQSLSTFFFFFFSTVGSLTSPVDDSFRRMGGQQASGITSCPCLTNTRVVGNAATLSFSTCALVIPTQVIMLAWWAFYLLFSQSLLPSSLCKDKLYIIPQPQGLCLNI